MSLKVTFESALHAAGIENVLSVVQPGGTGAFSHASVPSAMRSEWRSLAKRFPVHMDYCLGVVFFERQQEFI